MDELQAFANLNVVSISNKINSVRRLLWAENDLNRSACIYDVKLLLENLINIFRRTIPMVGSYYRFYDTCRVESPKLKSYRFMSVSGELP